jgi:hypothetical protein
MYQWLEANLRHVLRNYLHVKEDGQVEVILIALFAFLIGLLASGRRIVVQ